ncbi:transcription factor bHLH18 [Arachis ipaensis]|nr:transcription factor bHLH18 [Arachis ipaensis]
MDHIMAERKRRQELTERFIALSATIPGLTKTDKASILRAAIDYVKQLQERVQELEKQNKKRSRESVILVKKSKNINNEKILLEESTIISTSETRRSEDGGTGLPDIEARFMGKDVLIEIHCEKENGIEMKILNQLENLHLFVTGSSVLPFGNSALGITIIAKMGDSCEMTVNDVVRNLREVFLKAHQNSHGI